LQDKYSATDIEKSLRIYKERHGDLNIPRDYCIPEDTATDEERADASEYPELMIGAPLGEILQALRGRRLYFNFDDIHKRWRKLGIRFSSDNK
jgi:hypothetical protein